jgi:hypothetical protein
VAHAGRAPQLSRLSVMKKQTTLKMLINTSDKR